MFLFRRARLALNPVKLSVSQRPCSPILSSVSCRSTTRALSTMAESKDNLFDYTSGRWVYNEARRLKERRLAFDVDGMRRLAAESMNQNVTDVVSFSKLSEDYYNRAFLVTLRGGQQVVARVPYPVMVPKAHAIASEAATIEYMRSHGIPAPKVYGYSTDSNNAAGTPYILMEFIHGSKLSEVWFSLSDEEMISVIHQLTQLEARMMSLEFPAGGSLYFAEDLKKVAKGLGVPLEDKRFCVGPDTHRSLWCGRRSELDVFRGPYLSAQAALETGAHKEIAYLNHFGKPLLPFRRERRSAYKSQPQLPSSHIENLERYLSIVPSLIPSDPALSRFCIRHPNLHPDDIFVSRSLDSGCRVISLFDWQYTSIRPMFVQAGIPQSIQNHDDPFSHSMKPPSLPDNFNELSEDLQAGEEYLYFRRLVHYQYVMSTKECNPLHHAAHTDPMYALRGRLFEYASIPWEGESFDLKVALIEAMDSWKQLTSGSVPCPLKFDARDLSEMEVLQGDVSESDANVAQLESISHIEGEGWVANEDYDYAMACLQFFKEEGLRFAESVEEVEEALTHWPWNRDEDEDEEPYIANHTTMFVEPKYWLPKFQPGLRRSGR